MIKSDKRHEEISQIKIPELIKTKQAIQNDL